MKPLISIVIPFYDHVAYLAEAVESALLQTYQNIEIIVVDDASPACDARQLLKDWLDNGLKHDKSKFDSFENRLAVIRTDVNGGSAAAKNTGIAASKGDFIVPLDSDDKLDSRYVESVLAAYLEANAIDFEFSGVFTWTQVFGLHNFVHTPDCSMLDIMSGKPAPTTFLYARQMFDQLGGYNSSVYHDDDEFWLRALSQGHRFFRLEQPLYYYRKHERGKSTTNRAAALSSFAKTHPSIYQKHLPAILETIEAKYFQSVDEYQILHDAFKELSAHHEDLEKRFAALSEQNVRLNRRFSQRLVDKVRSVLKGPVVKT